MKCYGFAVFWNFRILKVVLGYKKWSKTAENEDSQRKIVELSNDMSDVFLAFLEMKCDTLYHGLHNHGELVDSCEGSPLNRQIQWQCDFEEFWSDFHQILRFLQNIRARSAHATARTPIILLLSNILNKIDAF